MRGAPVEVVPTGGADRLVRWGGGPVHLFALHGWGGSHDTFARLAEHLDERFSLWAPDLPGYGRAAPLDRWEQASYLARVRGLFAHLPAEPVHLLGNCSGAILGLAALCSPPERERLAGLVLVDPFAFTPWYLRLFLLPLVGRLFFWSTFANPMGRHLTNLSLASKRQRDTDLTGSFAEVPPSTAWNTLRLLDEIGTIRGFASVVRPSLLLHGRRTFAAVRASIPLWRAIWPHLEVREIPAAGHLPLTETPREVAAHLARFLLTPESGER